MNETSSDLKNLCKYLHDLREKERSTIAKTIHDELGQMLTVIKMELSWMSNNLDKGPKLLSDKIQCVIQLVDSTMKTAQYLSNDLRPGILDIYGLKDAVEWEAKEFHKSEGINCQVRCEGNELRNKHYSTILFRIIQEALLNISLHAKATEAEVQLKVDKKYVNLVISDNGRGIPREMVNSKKSMGLMSMRERISSLNGSFSISGNKKNGTKINISLPLEGKIND
ncbi:MAG: sensor histidine kinase [Promethearchaeota archaeon]|jgi:signal transduction histidine kinase